MNSYYVISGIGFEFKDRQLIDPDIIHCEGCSDEIKDETHNYCPNCGTKIIRFSNKSAGAAELMDYLRLHYDKDIDETLFSNDGRLQRIEHENFVFFGKKEKCEGCSYYDYSTVTAEYIDKEMINVKSDYSELIEKINSITDKPIKLEFGISVLIE